MGQRLPWLQVPGSLSLTPAAIKLSFDASGQHASKEEQQAGASPVATADKAAPTSAAPSGWDLDPTPIPVSFQQPCQYNVTALQSLLWVLVCTFARPCICPATSTAPASISSTSAAPQLHISCQNSKCAK